MTEWTPLVRKRDKNVGFLQFVDLNMYATHILFHGDAPPRMLPELQKILQLSKKKRIGDLYLAKKYTILRIYGSELKPYRLPVYLTPIILAMEYIRQRLSSDHTHFAVTK